MKLLSKNIFILLLLIAGSANAAVRVFAQVDNGDIYVGERFGYHIIIDGDNKPGHVDTSILARYDPQSAGNRDVSQSSISIANGKTTRNIKKQYVMSYSLVCDHAGKVILAPLKVTVDGTDYQTNQLEVNILEPGTTDQLDLEISLSRKECYIGQAVLMTVKFYVSADIGNFQLNIPAFTSGDFYLEQPDDINPQSKEYDLGNGTVVNVTQYRTTHKGRDSVLLSFSKVLIPKHSGDIEILPASVSADVAVGRARSRDRFFDGFFGAQKEYKRFVVSSNGLDLKVLDLPQAQKPSGFYGLVGKYSISTSAEPVKVSVGEPITLTVKICGDFLKPVKWPDLQGPMADNFKIPSEKASPVIEDGCKVFTQTIRVANNEVSKIPSIPLAYFDSDKGKYNVIQTRPIELDVSATRILTSADLEGVDFTVVNKEVEAVKKGLSANYEDLNILVDQSFSPSTAAVGMPYLLIWAGPLVLFAASCLVKSITHTNPEKIAARRRATASTRVIGKLKKTDCSQSELIASIMKEYIAERFDRVAGTLTCDDCLQIILERTLDKKSAQKYGKIIADCEMARYASGGSDGGYIEIKEIISLIKMIEKNLKK